MRCTSRNSKLQSFQDIVLVASECSIGEMLSQQSTRKENSSEPVEPVPKPSHTGFWMEKSDKEPLTVSPEDLVTDLSKVTTQIQAKSEQDFMVMLGVKFKDEKLERSSFPAEFLPPPTIKSEEGRSTPAIDQMYIPPIDKYFLFENTFPEAKSLVGQYAYRELLNKKAVCKLCGAKFSRMTRLKAHHLALHTDIRPHACDQCDAAFAMRWDLTLHQRLHAGTFQCEFCQKSFTARNKLERHRRTHTGERPFPCPHCDKAFGEKRNLDNHIRIHTGERPYQCSICMKSFRVRTHLTDHRKAHSETARYTCKLCDRPFKWKANYSLHMKMHFRSMHSVV